MDKHIVDYIITLIGVLGSSGFFVGFFGYLKAQASAKTAKQAMEAQARSERESAEHKRRLEALELRQKQQEAEAEQARLDRENARHLIDNNQRIADGSFRKDEMWQKVVSEMSERKHEDNAQLAKALKDLAASIRNQTEMQEVQTEQMGNLDKTVQDGVKIVEQLARDNRADMTTALGLSVSQRAESEKMLQTILKTVHDVAREVGLIITKNEDNRLFTLQGINAKLHTIEANIAALITPQPVTLADTIPLPDSAEPALPASGNTETSTPDNPQLKAL